MNEEPVYKDEASLEGPDLSMAMPPSDTIHEIPGETPSGQPTPQRRPVNRKALLVALAIILLLLLLAGGAYTVLRMTSKKTVTTTTVTVNTQSLDNGTLNKLTAQAGTPIKQQLVISPDTIFKNSVTIHNGLDTSGDVNIGGNLSVKGTSTLQGSVGVNGNLAVHGSLSVSGALTAPSLNVGNLGITNLTASGSLSFGGHLIPSGATPSGTPSVAASGGTVTVSGNDTAGTVTITTGGSATLAGEMAIISFHTAFATTPKVQLTPITSSAAGLRYYATRSPGFFTIDTATAPDTSTNYVFDYLVTQ